MLLKELQKKMPIKVLKSFNLAGREAGLGNIDLVDGFLTPGGKLGPQKGDRVIRAMRREAVALAQEFRDKQKPSIFVMDTHDEKVPEPPYPVHCVRGSGEEKLIPELAWAYKEKTARLVEKGCINGVIGGINFTIAHKSVNRSFYGRQVVDQIEIDSGNEVLDWMNATKIKVLVVTGICTDICVTQFVQAVLSARNLGILHWLEDVVVATKACATYNFPIEAVKSLGRPETEAHPRDIAHHIGLWMMQQSGAILAEKVTF